MLVQEFKQATLDVQSEEEASLGETFFSKNSFKTFYSFRQIKTQSLLVFSYSVPIVSFVSRNKEFSKRTIKQTNKLIGS